MIGCDVSQSENGGGDNRKEPSYFTVSFYDVNLDLEGQTKVDVRNPTIDIAQLKTDLALSAPQLYRAGSAEKVETNALYPITGDTNFYAIASVKEIRTEIELSAVRDNLSHNYILINDIALTSATLNETAGWEPIGDSYSSFSGIFNGNGHKITGLRIDRSSMQYVGLFGFTNGAVIKNIGVEIANGKEVKGDYYVGGIVGYVADGSITNSYSTGDISGTRYVGGIVGRVADGSITNSYATGNISGGDYYVGGIVGYVATGGDITNSYATGNISGTQYVGGVVGSVYYGTVTNNAAINPS
ncbi:MAG: hypothetical protein LBE89_05735, partial [Helicobacteraceae bacterium]|nr:hypothetical protein [Helicobacteraceae bacterium]